ncbi:hypothetical protein JCM6882_000873 [Rhodosporidiobolus microsporus]
MGGEDIATAQLLYGVKVSSASLFFEVLDLFRDRLIQQARATALELEERFLRRTVCGECEGSKPDQPLPRWFAFQGFGSREQRWAKCGTCNKQGRAAMSRVYKHDIAPFLASYTLETDWRKWTSCETDSEFSEYFNASLRKKTPSNDDNLLWLRGGADFIPPEVEKPSNSDDNADSGATADGRPRYKTPPLPPARKRSPRAIVLLTPRLSKDPRELPPSIMQGSWTRYNYHVEYSRTMRLEDLEALSRFDRAYKSFFRDWDVSVGDQKSGQTPRVLIKFVMRPYEGNRNETDF